MGAETAALAVEIGALEERLLDPRVRASRDALDRLLCDDFVEFGASGRVFDKRAILEMLPVETERSYGLAELRVTPLGPELALATYRAVCRAPGAQPRHSLRSSLWRREDGAWRLLFHQGTATEPSG